MNKSSTEYLNIIKHSPTAMLILTPNFKIIHANISYLEATMAEKRNIIEKNIFEAFPDNPSDRSANGVTNLNASLKKVLKTRKPQKLPVQKYDVPLPDGTFQEKYWDVLNVPVIGDNGEIDHIIHSVTDVTQQVKTEAALELAVGAAQLGTWEIDLQKNAYIHRNPRHDILYGYAVKQSSWSHDTAKKKILNEDLATYDRAFSEALSTGTIDFEVRTQWEDNTIHWIEVKGKVYFNSNGTPSKAAGVNLDITEQRLTEKALRKAKEEAESAVKAKDEFLSTMSHEIRTPLNAVIGLSNLLLEDNLTENQAFNLNALNFAADNLLHLVNNVLDYSKIQAGKIEVNDENFNLYDLIEKLIKTHEPKAVKKNVELSINFEQKVPKMICSDPFLLSQILHNLIGNALKFTYNGLISVSVEFIKEEKEKKWLRFSIEDSGKGIAPDKLDYIFQKFAQQRNFSDTDHEGTGLGLSITKSLVETLGGEIGVKSIPGEGSKFYFTLPTVEASLCSTEESLVNNQQEQFPDLRKKQILLVEDVEINRSIILQYLKKWWDLKPDEAEDGEQALRMVQKKNYKLILMDLRMPNMDGYEASKKIREMKAYRETPILAFTAETKKDPKHLHLFDDRIFKPFEPADLKNKIQKHLVGLKIKDKLRPGTENEEMRKGERPVFDIERYKKMSDGEPQVLKKFLRISVRAFKKYREDFLAVKEAASLSDLIHRNSMNTHYINTVVLNKKIREFESSLISHKPAAQLQKEKNEILEEFDCILNGLKKVIMSLQ